MCPLKPHSPALPILLALCFIPSLLVFIPSLLVAQGSTELSASKARRHEDPAWVTVQAHLPDPAIATAHALEEQGDLLRIRRFPEDALEYYGFAVRRGGPSANLLNKIGLTQLELRNIVLAQGYFRQAIKMDRRNPQGWNNLAATEYLERQYGSAVSDYKRAVKLDRACAVFHANLGTAYFETKDYKGSRREASEALRLDPLVYQHSNGSGIAAHVLSVEDRARFFYEMAKLYAQHGREEEMLLQLAKSAENGFDILGAMTKDPELAKYRGDPRVTLIVLTAKIQREGAPAVVAKASAPVSGKDSIQAR